MANDELFDAMNPYQSLTVITGKTPDDLVEKLKAIKTPYKIFSFTASNNRHHAYIQGDHRIVKKVRKKAAIKKG